MSPGRVDDLSDRLRSRLDPGAGEPLSQQIVHLLWEDVVSGLIEAGARLPTVRQLAIDLGVHPNVVIRAYDELEDRGVLVTQAGGTYVSLSPRSATEAVERYRELRRLCRDLVARAQALGFELEDVIDAVAELREQDAAEEDQTEEVP